MLTIILLLLSAIAKACADTLEFRYAGSIFYKWSIQNTGWGYFWKYWSGPEAWDNKNDWKSPLALLLARTVFAFTQDAWHFFQMVMLTSLQLIIVLNVEPVVESPSLNMLILLSLIKFVTGIVFELFWNDLLIYSQGRARLEYEGKWKSAILAAYPTMALWINIALVATPFVGLTLSHYHGLVSDATVIWGVIASGVGAVYLLIKTTRR
jgi:hypothetical protein